MSEKFKDIYRIPTTRAKWWDYSHRGLYFITICAYGMEFCLGKIENNEMHLSDIGKIAEKYWLEIPDHFPFVKLHAMVVMPNHIHGIMEILPVEHVETVHAPSVPQSPEAFVETLHSTSQHAHASKNQRMKSISPPQGSLASVIRSYKSAVSKQAHILHPHFGWHERYYDKIIIDIPAYQRIEAYIKNNVSSWNKDKFFKKHS